MEYPKRPLELYTYAAEESLSTAQWRELIDTQYCRYRGAKCFKVRKSNPDLTIGSCTVGYGGKPVVICPYRFVQRQQIFLDAIHLLDHHEPGNQIHVVPEITIPGGNVDYFVASVNRDEIRDYIALEIQTLDTTGTVWPSREQFVTDVLSGSSGSMSPPVKRDKSYGMNWKMTAKTILVQMHHKVMSLELLGKKMILACQDLFFDYIEREFQTSSLRTAEKSDSAHFHSYTLNRGRDMGFDLELASRHSTTTVGIEQMLGRRESLEITQEDLVTKISAKMSDDTLLKV